MRISRIYYDGFLEKWEDIDLPPETSHYITNVLRLKVGATVVLFNGQGGEFIAYIKAIQKKSVLLELGEYKDCDLESPLCIHLAQAISRNEKMDLILQKTVELGVKKVTPLVTEFSNVKLDKERAAKRLIHWQKVIISACEQSGRTIIPTLEPIQDYQSWLDTDLAACRLYCDPHSKNSVHALEPQHEVVLLIGPEGGLSHKEVADARAHHFIDVSLGPRILRTETAPIAAMAILQNCWGDL